MKVGVLASGGLGFQCLKACAGLFKPIFIATDSRSSSIIQFATDNRIALFKGNPRQSRLDKFLGQQNFDILFSINYLFLLEKDVISKASYAINFHGSLLPRYRGRTPHVWSIINNEKETGVTAHIIDEGCDSGAIVLQERIAISDEDTGAAILAKYESIYPAMIQEVLEKFKTNSLKLAEQDHSKATYYGKRTPEDGAINWNWQKERIKNWIRAQADPYPGAFATIGDEKIIIDKIIFSGIGYKDTDPNGLILSVDPVAVVKTPNGAIELATIRTNAHLISKGKILQ